ncbi:hypothetical protein Salat_1432300 [Sesamum alatum]|uniref:Myb/SANT-like domain-containing protein n=1 Tax=Sesamum alatum TaxID=300844 RepID=A0AAE2CLI9_9LAMI|nr:hypothetical protein Salat_1432300 [Sesamum alatum]
MTLVDEEGTSKPWGCRVKSDKPHTRRSWTQHEEDVLVNALRTIVTTGWKKNYDTLTCIMAKNGFGWDDSRCMITVDSQDIWNEFCKYTNDRPPVVDLADDKLDNETPKCYIPTAEWCPNTGYAGNDNGTVAETQANVDVNVTSTISHKRIGSSGKKRKGEDKSAR